MTDKQRTGENAWGPKAFFIRLAIASIALFILIHFGFLDS